MHGLHRVSIWSSYASDFFTDTEIVQIRGSNTSHNDTVADRGFRNNTIKRLEASILHSSLTQHFRRMLPSNSQKISCTGEFIFLTQILMTDQSIESIIHSSMLSKNCGPEITISSTTGSCPDKREPIVIAGPSPAHPARLDTDQRYQPFSRLAAPYLVFIRDGNNEHSPEGDFAKRYSGKVAYNES